MVEADAPHLAIPRQPHEHRTTVIGVKVTQRAMGKAIARYAPFIGAAGVAAYAMYDTRRVATTAIELFGGEVELEAQEATQP